MNIRKYWLNDEIFIYAISDNDQRLDYPTATDYYIGRRKFGTLEYVFGEEEVDQNEEESIETLYENGYFDGLIKELMKWV